MGFLSPPKTLGSLEEENEKKGIQLSIAQKQALINEAKKRYGKDWRQHIPNIKSGLDWNALKFKL